MSFDLSHISAINYPSINSLWHSVEQRLTGSLDLKKAKTTGSWLAHFLGFVNTYNFCDTYLTNDHRVISDVFGTYTTFLLEGFTIKTDSKIMVQTIREYLLAVNEHYKANGFDIPYIRNDDSRISNLLNSAEEFNGVASKRNPLNHKMTVMMHQLAQEDPLGFKAAVYEFTALGCFGGFCRQEFAMDSKNKIYYYFLTDNTKVGRDLYRT